MPPKGAQKTKPFKPPRPSVAKSGASAASSRRVSGPSTTAKTSKSDGKAKSTKEPEAEHSDNVIDDDDDPFASSEVEADKEDSQPEADVEEPDIPEITIEPELLTKILHEFFTADGGMRISKDASKAVGKYMHTFVQEALHRAAAENREAAEKNGGVGGNDMFLEVEDLEKLAPQMLLDF